MPIYKGTKKIKDPRTLGGTQCASLYVGDKKVHENTVYEDADGNRFIYAGGGAPSILPSTASPVKIIQTGINGGNSLSYMLNGKTNLTEVQDSADWKTGNVTTMDKCFYGCNELLSLVADNWDTSKVTSLANTFASCYALTSVGDLSSWDTSNVTNMSGIFYNCNALTSVGDLSSWDTSNVTNMRSMFSGADIVELNLGGWNTANVTTMIDFVRGAKNLEKMDIHGWDMAGSLLNFFHPSTTTKLTWIDMSNTKFSRATTRIQIGQNVTTLIGDHTLDEVEESDGVQKAGGIVVMEGNKFDVETLTNVNIASVMAVFYGLADMTGETQPYIKVGSTNLALLSEAQKDVARNKNWDVQA